MSLQKSLQSCKGALLVIQPAGGYKLLIAAPDSRPAAVVEIQVAAQDLALLHAQLLCRQLHQRAAALACKQRQQVNLLVELEAVVYLPIHMDGHIGDQHQVPVEIDEAGGNGPASLAHQDPPGDGEGAVHPGAADHAAVSLGIEPGVFAVYLQLRLLLDLEYRGVAVGGGDIEAVALQLRPHPEGDDAGAVAADIVALPLLQPPGAALQQLMAARAVQGGFQGGHSVEGGGISLDKGQHFLC